MVHSKFNEVTRILLLCKENKTTILFNNLLQRSTILENIRWTQAAYALLCQPHHKDTSSTLVYALNGMKTAHPCGAADTDERALLYLILQIGQH